MSEATIAQIKASWRKVLDHSDSLITLEESEVTRLLDDHDRLEQELSSFSHDYGYIEKLEDKLNRAVELLQRIHERVHGEYDCDEAVVTFDEWWNGSVETPPIPEIGLYPTSSTTPRRIYYSGSERAMRVAWEAGAAEMARQLGQLATPPRCPAIWRDETQAIRCYKQAEHIGKCSFNE